MPFTDSWLRTRLRAAPASALALAALVLVTAFLGAALPRAVDRYEDRALRQAVTDAAPRDRGVSLSDDYDTAGDPAGEDRLRPGSLDEVERDFRRLLSPPLRITPSEVVQGVRSGAEAEVPDPELPRTSDHAPGADLVAQAGLAGHVRVVAGALPRPEPSGGPAALALDGMVTEKTARVLRLKVGQRVHLRKFGANPLTVTISGIVVPRDPAAGYWTTDDDLLAPLVSYPPHLPIDPPHTYWHFTVLIDPTAARSLPLLGTGASMYWHHPLDAAPLTAHDVPALRAELAALGNGPLATQLATSTGSPSLHAVAGVGSVLYGFAGDRTASRPLVLIAAFGVGTTAFAVLLMAAALAADRRRGDLSLLRSRGGSLRGIFLRLVTETAAAAVPAGAAGTALALLALPTGRSAAALALGALVTAAGTLAMPLRATLAVRRPRPAEREDLVALRPSRRRLVLELTVTVLVAGAVAALRRRGTADGADPFLAAAPVLVAVAGALVLLRLYPLPLRRLARPAARLRGAVAHLGLARAGRASSGGQLPLLALLVALTVASFGGSVLAGISHGRDRAAAAAVGGDARVDSIYPLDAGLPARVAKVRGVGEVAAVRVEPHAANQDIQLNFDLLIIDDPAVYARITRVAGMPAFPAGTLGAEVAAGSHGPLPAVVSPRIADLLGGATKPVETGVGISGIRAAATLPATPAVGDGDFVIISGRQLHAQHPRLAAYPQYGGPTLLLAGAAHGQHIDAAALRKATAGSSSPATVELRSDKRAELSDNPLQRGARALYLAAVAAGAGYSVLALLLSLMAAAPGRLALLARLRTLGMPQRQSRRLVLLESLPQVLLAAVGGVLVGLAVVPLLGPGIDLHALTFGSSGRETPQPSTGIGLRADPWSLALPSAVLLLLACAVLLGQAWLSGRRRESTELRAGDRTT
ncbi:FtsX-like permease family protein [Actinacidiphila paucisporea]|uniref:Putative ABC transport system permease protein n=1 Tax=Actinacidiphila paucisporea TaxID=310782 RepID=A0A1M6WT70_9ACTN|nr:FtsX-like permease family protein [Actinacidiphila paucisporea]SHK96844.1 putative ABC transport system permease protein [Actinacidiphila paucisporea]